MTEQYQCQSYSDDDRNVQDCTCGKCGNTSDTEMGKAELAVFWDEIAQHLPKSIERSALGDEKIFDAFATAYPNMRQHLITSRDKYWKERVSEARSGVIKTVEDTIAEFGDQGMKCVAGILEESFHGQQEVEH